MTKLAQNTTLDRNERKQIQKGIDSEKEYHVDMEAEQLILQEVKQHISLDNGQQIKINKSVKYGAYKELHKRGLLSDIQLNELLSY